MYQHFRKRAPEAGRRLRLRVPPGDQGQGARRLRGLLPAASLSNVGIYGTGQAYEQLLLRMRAHPLPEAREYADMMLTELRKVIPSFLSASTSPTAAARGRDYLATTAARWRRSPTSCSRRRPSPSRATEVTLVDFDPDAENKHGRRDAVPVQRPARDRIADRVRADDADEKVSRRAGLRRRPQEPPPPARPGARAVWYRFDMLSDYGAFRDLQRHRMLTIEWQPLTPRHGYDTARGRRRRRRAADLRRVDGPLGRAARRPAPSVPGPGAVRGALWPTRCATRCSSTPGRRCTCSSCAPSRQGHPSYRQVCQEMHRLIAIRPATTPSPR